MNWVQGRVEGIQRRRDGARSARAALGAWRPNTFSRGGAEIRLRRDVPGTCSTCVATVACLALGEV